MRILAMILPAPCFFLPVFLCFGWEDAERGFAPLRTGFAGLWRCGPAARELPLALRDGAELLPPLGAAWDGVGVEELFRGEKLGGAAEVSFACPPRDAECPVLREGMKLGGLSQVSCSPDSCAMCPPSQDSAVTISTGECVRGVAAAIPVQERHIRCTADSGPRCRCTDLCSRRESFRSRDRRCRLWRGLSVGRKSS